MHNQNQSNTNMAAAYVRVPLTPAQYLDQPLNFDEHNDIAIFKKGCKPLEWDKYDGKNLSLFFSTMRLQEEAEKREADVCARANWIYY